MLAILSVELVSNRTYTLGVLATAALVASVLTGGLLHLDQVFERTDAATTLLLAGPGLFAALVAQPGRGSLVAQLVVGARAILIWSGLLAFLGAATLVALPSLRVAEHAWLALAAFAWVNVGLLVVAVVNPGSILRARKGRKAKIREATIDFSVE